MKKTIIYFFTGVAICFSLSENLLASSDDRALLLPPAERQPRLSLAPIGATGEVQAEQPIIDFLQRTCPTIGIQKVRTRLKPWLQTGRDRFMTEAYTKFSIADELSGPLFDEWSRFIAAQQRQTTAPAPSAAAATTSRPADWPRGRLCPQGYAGPDQLAAHATAPSLAPAAPVRELEPDSRASSGRGSDTSSPPVTPVASDSRRSSDPSLTSTPPGTAGTSTTVTPDGLRHRRVGGGGGDGSGVEE